VKTANGLTFNNVNPGAVFARRSARNLSPVMLALLRSFRFFSLACLVVLGGLAMAEPNRPVEPSALFSNGVVLQRDRPIVLWGTATQGTKVDVKFRQQSASAVTNESGRWTVTLRPEKAGGPDVLTFETAKGHVTVNDVMVGEVWLAAGQSNMFFKIKSMKPPFAPEPATGNPGVRFFSVAQRAVDQPDTGLRGSWQIADAQNAPEMSAVAYFFASELQAKLNVPVGIVVSAVGGTSVSAWSSAESLASEPDASSGLLADWKTTLANYPETLKTFEGTFAAWDARRKQAEAAGQPFEENKPRAPLGPDSPKRPMALYNGMVHPLIPLTFRGVLWYQGESDATRQRAQVYATLLPAMIRDWRARWGQPDLPFLIVQLPAFKQDEDWGTIQRAQQEVASGAGNGMITTLDLGVENNVHPHNKKPVGLRLANLALADVYGWQIPAHPPRAISVHRDKQEIVLTLACDDGITLVLKPPGSPQGFEVAGADGVYFPATTKAEGNQILASAKEVAEPVSIRYAGESWPVLGVFDSLGLPLGPLVMQVP
jgi:sialate O-acetylesterase